MKRGLLFILMGLFTLKLFAGESKEAVFWRWFQANDSRLFACEKDSKAVFDALATAMDKVHPDLTFEFGPIRTDGRREFVISAAGIKAAFPNVEALYAAAPKIDHWIFVKFRPRRFPLHDLKFAAKEIRAQDVHYLLIRDKQPGKVGIVLFLDGYREAEKTDFGQMGYLFLDEALGEYDVEMKVGVIIFQGRDAKHFGESHPLPELPQDFDRYFQGHN